MSTEFNDKKGSDLANYCFEKSEVFKSFWSKDQRKLELLSLNIKERIPNLPHVF